VEVFKSKGRRHTRLDAELKRLQESSGLGIRLKVFWVPREKGNLAGEVKDSAIYVYDHDQEEALETLRHEFFDYCMSRAIEPYKDIANKLIAFINEDAYRRKERVIEAVIKLLKEGEQRAVERDEGR